MLLGQLLAWWRGAVRWLVQQPRQVLMLLGMRRGLGPGLLLAAQQLP